MKKVLLSLAVLVSSAFAQLGTCAPNLKWDAANGQCIPADYNVPTEQEKPTLQSEDPLASSPLLKFLYEVKDKLTSAPGQYSMPSFTVELSTKPEVNAYGGGNKVVINIALLQAFYGSPGELAFILAHEIGHVQDSSCMARMGTQNIRGVAAKRSCEATADYLGMQYLIAAGFNPWDAAGAMGRLMMAAPQRNSVTGLIIGRFIEDHPVSIDRINQLGVDANRVCMDRPEICRAGMWGE